MKHAVIVMLSVIAVTTMSRAYDCKVFIPTEKGAEYTTTFYDKKGKVTSYQKRILKEVTTSGAVTTFKMYQEITNKKGKDPKENTYEFKCDGGVFYVDMKLFLNQPQLKAYEDMEMTVDADDLEMPKDGTAGQKLKDGSVTMTVNMGMQMKIEIDIKNRSVGGEEEVETPAGTFKCIKLVEDVYMKIAFAKVSYQTVTWYAENHGVIKQETYDIKKKKKTGYSMLTEIKK